MYYFFVWLLSFSIIIIRFIHVVVYIVNSFSLLSSILWFDCATICKSFHLLMDIELFLIFDYDNCSEHLSSVVSSYTLISLGVIPKCGMIGSFSGFMNNMLKKTSKLFLKVVQHLTIPPVVCEVSSSSICLLTLGLFDLFYFTHCKVHSEMSHGFTLHFPGG